jgi:hypothetical protein
MNRRIFCVYLTGSVIAMKKPLQRTCRVAIIITHGFGAEMVRESA